MKSNRIDPWIKARSSKLRLKVSYRPILEFKRNIVSPFSIRQESVLEKRAKSPTKFVTTKKIKESDIFKNVDEFIHKMETFESSRIIGTMSPFKNGSRFNQTVNSQTADGNEWVKKAETPSPTKMMRYK
jgi:hypothetical protein